jgi:hypothetical protein
VLSSRFGLIVTAGLVAVAAVVGGAILFTSSKASEVNLTTASLVPEDAGVYIALNTDLTSSQWVSTFNLVKRLGTKDPEGDLKDNAELTGLDWEDDIAPFLGGNGAVYFKGVSISDVSAEGAVILRCKDAKKALRVVEDQAGRGDEDSYGGVDSIEVMDGGYAARIGDHLVLAFDLDSLKTVIDVSNGKQKALASVDDFQRLRDELTGNFLGFVYVSAQDLVGDFFLDDPVIKAAVDDSGTGDLVFKPAAWVIGAKKDGFEFQAASVGKSDVVSPMIAPRTSKLADLVPADAGVFFSTTNIAQTWDKVMAEARPEIDKAIQEEGEYRNLDEALKAGGKELGIDSIEEIIKLLKGETAVAAWFPDGDSENPDVAFLAEVDQSAADALLTKITTAKPSVSRPQKKSVNGHDYTIFRDEDGDESAYGFLQGNLVLGSRTAVERVLSNQDPALSELKRYRQTVAAMPTGLGSYAFINLSSVLRLAEGGVPADLSEAERALSGLIINVVDERGIVRLSGILTVED